MTRRARADPYGVAMAHDLQAILFKMNTFGEEAFLRRVVDAIQHYAP